MDPGQAARKEARFVVKVERKCMFILSWLTKFGEIVGDHMPTREETRIPYRYR